MGFINISVMLAITFTTFFVYHHPPWQWTFIEWLRKPVSVSPNAPDALKPDLTAADFPKTPSEKKIMDQQLMPPPLAPSSSRNPTNGTSSRVVSHSSSQAAPRVLPPVPTFTMNNSLDEHNKKEEDEEFDNSYIPSFPAANSAQRASSGGGARNLGTARASPAPIPTGTMQPPLRSVNIDSMLSAPAQPRLKPLPNRNPTAALRATPSSVSSSLFPSSLAPARQTTPNARHRVLLAPGHSPLDWAALTASPNAAPTLRGLSANTPYLRVPPSRLKMQNGRKGRDAWTVLSGKVYNITPYLPFHPGGEGELLRCAGRDGTRLFDEIHRWVNYETMLAACMVGIAVAEGEEVTSGDGKWEEMD